MKLSELKEKIGEYQYIEDGNVIDALISAVLCTSLSLGAPVWLVVIGASSGGKTQMLKPVSMTNPAFIHNVDDLTPNTLLSGANVGKGKDASLLTRIGKRGIITVSDMTGIFSKATEARDEILGALRMVYDGYYTKNVGNRAEPLKWEGSIGIIAGSTPSIYTHFEAVADMGERFIYYRMKEYNAMKATQIAMARSIYGKELHQKLSDYYKEYIQGIIEYHGTNEIPDLPEEIKQRIMKVAVLTERIRTTSAVDWHGNMNKLPVAAYPMRLSLQMRSIAKGLQVMRLAEGSDLGVEDFNIIDWLGYSLANEEKRACLRKLCERPFDSWIKTQTVSDLVGLNETVIQPILQNLSAIGIVARSGSITAGHGWRMASQEDWKLIREIEGIAVPEKVEAIKPEEVEENFMDKIWNK